MNSDLRIPSRTVRSATRARAHRQGAEVQPAVAVPALNLCSPTLHSNSNLRQRLSPVTVLSVRASSATRALFGVCGVGPNYSLAVSRHPECAVNGNQQHSLCWHRASDGSSETAESFVYQLCLDSNDGAGRMSIPTNVCSW